MAGTLGVHDVASIYEEHADGLVASTRRVVGSAPDAEDAVADAFEALLSATLHDPARAPGWLRVVAGNRGRNRIRSRDRERARLALVADDGPVAAPAVPDDTVTDLLTSALGRLSGRERHVVMRRVVDGASVAEVAGELGLSANNVRVINHRALARLRASITDELAAHHRLATSCQEVLGRDRLPAAHCERCLPFVDEIQALAGRAAALGLPAGGSRLRTALEHLVGRWGLGHAPPTLPEAVAAAIAGLLALGPTAASVPDAAGDGPGALEVAGAAVLDVDRQVGGLAGFAWSAPSSAVPLPTADDATVDGARSLGERIVDDADDAYGGAIGDSTTFLPGTGTPVPLMEASPEAPDIVAMSVTAIEVDGAVTGLRFTVEMDREPSAATTWLARWHHPDDGCSVEMRTDERTDDPGRRYGWAGFFCDAPMRYSTLDVPTNVAGGPAQGRAHFRGVVDGPIVTLDLLFERLDEGQRRLFRPGTELTGIRVMATNGHGEDSAPQSTAGATYRMPG